MYTYIYSFRGRKQDQGKHSPVNLVEKERERERKTERKREKEKESEREGASEKAR